VRHDVIGNIRRRHDPAREAKLAERMLGELQLAQPLPGNCPGEC
jgi:hypothetical protein